MDGMFSLLSRECDFKCCQRIEAEFRSGTKKMSTHCNLQGTFAILLLVQNNVWFEGPGVTFITAMSNLNGKLLQAAPHISNELENISQREMLTL